MSKRTFLMLEKSFFVNSKNVTALNFHAITQIKKPKRNDKIRFIYALNNSNCLYDKFTAHIPKIIRVACRRKEKVVDEHR